MFTFVKKNDNQFGEHNGVKDFLKKKQFSYTGYDTDTSQKLVYNILNN